MSLSHFKWLGDRLPQAVCTIRQCVPGTVVFRMVVWDGTGSRYYYKALPVELALLWRSYVILVLCLYCASPIAPEYTNKCPRYVHSVVLGCVKCYVQKMKILGLRLMALNIQHVSHSAMMYDICSVCFQSGLWRTYVIQIPIYWSTAVCYYTACTVRVVCVVNQLYKQLNENSCHQRSDDIVCVGVLVPGMQMSYMHEDLVASCIPGTWPFISFVSS